MTHKILILYASAKGTTKGIAEHISSHISAVEPSLGSITCLSVTEAPPDEEIQTYDAIILGSAIHSAKWLPSMTQWLSKHVSGSVTPAAPKPDETAAPATTAETPAAPAAPPSPKKSSVLVSTLKPANGIYAFSVGVPNELPKFLRSKETAKEEEHIRERLDNTYALKGTLKTHGFFWGVAEKSDVPFGLRTVFRWVGGKLGDFSDEGLVDQWCDGVVKGIKGGVVEQNPVVEHVDEGAPKAGEVREEV